VGLSRAFVTLCKISRELRLNPHLIEPLKIREGLVYINHVVLNKNAKCNFFVTFMYFLTTFSLIQI
jgi:hypothetical protein